MVAVPEKLYREISFLYGSRSSGKGQAFLLGVEREERQLFSESNASKAATL